MDLKYYHWIMFAKERGECTETGKPFTIGDTIMYVPGTKGLHKAYTYSKESKFYKENEKSIRTGWKI